MTGIVTDKATGAAVANVPVACYGPDTPASGAMVLTSMSDKTGHYTLRVTPGSNRIYVESDNGTTAAVVVQVPPTGIATADFTVDAAAMAAELRAAMAAQP